MGRKSKRIFIFMKKTKGEKMIHIVMFSLFFLWALTYLVPFVWLFIQSLHDRLRYSLILLREGAFAIPKEFQWENYVTAFKLMEYDGTTLIEMYFNSAWYIFIGVTWCIFWPVLTAYIFAKYTFKGRETLYNIVIFTMIIPVFGSTGAFFKLITGLHLYDTGPLFVILTGVTGFSGSFLIYYGIFKSLSWSYAESVFVDGGGNFRAFWSVMLPQAMPAIGATMITTGMGLWGEYYSFMMYLPSTPTVATGLYFISLTIDRFGRPLYYAGLVLSMIPVLVVYAFSSDGLMKNLSIGGLKG